MTVERDPDGMPGPSVDDDPAIAELREELMASLSVGVTPEGWQHRIQWSRDGSPTNLMAASVAPNGSLRIEWDRTGLSGRTLTTVVFVAGGTAIAWFAWGWKAGLAGLMAAIGLKMALGLRSGPRPGQMIKESFVPPEVLFELGVAGKTLLSSTTSRPEFFVERPATVADRRSARSTYGVVTAGFLLGGTLTLLFESHVIGPAAYVRAGALLGAVVAAAFAIGTWRRLGRLIPHLEPVPATEEPSPLTQVLDSATTGGTTDAVTSALLSRLPPRVFRLVVTALVLLWAVVIVLVAFNVTPDRKELWSGLAASVELTVFVLAAVRAVSLGLLAVLRQDGAAFAAALRTVALMAVLVLVAALFGWLDDWGDAADWVLDRVP